jgi:hypothetical protein
MKYLLLCICLACSVLSEAQQKKAEKTTKTKNVKTTVKKKPAAAVVNLVSVDSNAAKATNRFNYKIADPVINSFNNNSGAKNNSFRYWGIPKSAFGIAHGKLTLYSTGATSAGTSTGSGSVGTGSSPGAAGTLGPAMGVNGKSIFAGWGPYGTRVITLQHVPDTSKNH